jgi:transposase-like protein
MIFGSKKVKCVFCKKDTKKKKAFTIKMKTAEGMHSTYACEPCAKEFEEMAQYVEKNIDKRIYTI